MADMCSEFGSLPWCSGSVTAAFYCANQPDTVECNGSDEIVGLVINGFSGNIPDTIDALTSLRMLNITSSHLFTIPEEFSLLPELRILNFNNVELSSSVPDINGGFPKLEELRILNQVSGFSNLPDSIWMSGKLRVLHVENAPTVTSIPASYGTLPLEQFIIRNTGITSPLPVFGVSSTLVTYFVEITPTSAFSDPDILHSENLKEFRLRFLSDATGAIPPSLGSSTTLEIFEMYGVDEMTGPLPATVIYATGIREFTLGRMDLQIPFPDSICSLFELRFLKIEGVFTGEIPHCIGNLQYLTHFELIGGTPGNCFPNENIIGTLPPGIVEVLVRGDFIRIRNTCLMGTLPELAHPYSFVLSDSLRVGTVDLQNNLFTSPYPKWMVSLLTDPDFQMSGICNFSNNQFCHKPVPKTFATAQCLITHDRDTNICGLCARPDSDCNDCTGQLNGPARYDRCGVCNGNNACVDCAGVPNGSSVYDQCDVCDGDGTVCIDCNGVLFGPARYDLCDVCGGDSSSCLDCSGTPFGSLAYDICDICGGSGASCADCDGVMGGPKEIDLCGECVDIDASGYKPSCVDCAGVAFGTLVRDRCHVCGGDGTSCEDARQVLAAKLALDRYGWLIMFPIVFTVLLCVALAYLSFKGSFKSPPKQRRAPAREPGGAEAPAQKRLSVSIRQFNGDAERRRVKKSQRGVV